MNEKEIIETLKSKPYWQSLLPNFNISNNVFKNDNSQFDFDNAQLKNAYDNLNNEGYYKLDEAIPKEFTKKLADGVKTLEKAGILPIFSILYDDYWLMMSRLQNILTKTLGDDWYLMPDIWAWNVQKGKNFAGFPVHRDLDDYYADENGNPSFLTLWINLTEATPLNSCIHILPLHLDPFYPDHMKEFPNKPENFYKFAFENIRALPAPAGSVLCWNVNTVHWGSRSTEHAHDARISLGYYMYRGKKKPEGAFDFKKEFSFEERLNMVAQCILRYKNRNKFTPMILEFANSISQEWDCNIQEN